MDSISYTISVRGKQNDIPVMKFLQDHFTDIPLNKIDSLFGFLEFCPLYGGRTFNGRQLSEPDVINLYDNGIGVRIPLTNHFVSEGEYDSCRAFLEKYHRKGNSVIITEDILAGWIRRDYPQYGVEASVIKDIDSQEKITGALELYDTVILPMRLCVDFDFLSRLEPKNKITLFANAGCAFNCPAKICYKKISRMNKFDGTSQENSKGCSKSRVPRPELGMVDFDIPKLISLGFTRFKLLRSRPGRVTGF
jgi:hypothetical protein